MTPVPFVRPPLTPREGWLSDGRQVLRFRPSRWDRDIQRLVLLSELLDLPLLPGTELLQLL